MPTDKSPPHLEPLRRSKLMDVCVVCSEVTDLQADAGDGVEWLCWQCQGLPEITLHKQCEGCGAWFVGTVATKRCGHTDACKEQG